jgi:hypothetical protein
VPYGYIGFFLLSVIPCLHRQSLQLFGKRGTADRLECTYMGPRLIRARTRRYLKLCEDLLQVRELVEKLFRVERHILDNELANQWGARRDACRAAEIARKRLELERMDLSYQRIEAGRALPFAEWQHARAEFHRRHPR